MTGQVFVQAKDLSEAPEPRNLASVGWRPKWWGQDGNLRVAAETITRKAEDDSASILREFAGRWPIGRDDRAKLSQFIALHTVRTPAWRSAYEAVSIEAICDTLGRERHDPDTEGAAIRAFLSDQLQVDALLKQVPRLASLLMSMHWTLLEFDEPLILRTGAAHTGSAGSMQDSTPGSSAPSPYRRNAARRVQSVTIQAERRRLGGARQLF